MVRISISCFERARRLNQILISRRTSIKVVHESGRGRFPRKNHRWPMKRQLPLLSLAKCLSRCDREIFSLLSLSSNNLSALTPNHVKYSHRGASINDICKSFGFLDPLPRCPHLELFGNVAQPLLLRPVFHDLPPPDADILSCGSLTLQG